MSELRFYSFVNYYLSSIQQGVQSFHVLHETFNKYTKLVSTEPVAVEDRLRDWSENHKTLIILNGGAHNDIEETYALLAEIAPQLSFPLPFDKFHEDQRSLGGVITACGCVLPEEIYNAVDFRKAEKYADPLQTLQRNAFYFVSDDKIQKIYRPGEPEHQLITVLKSCSLAR